MLKRLFVFLILVGPAGCRDDRLGSLDLKVAGPIPVDVPREFSVPAGSPWKPLLRAGGAGGGLLFQEAPGLFSSPGNEMARRLCAVFPAGTTGGTLEVREGLAEENPFEYRESTAGRLMLFEEGKPVLGYNYGMQSPPDIPEDRWRSTYVHPLYDLSGTIVTDDFPKDHYHHRGLSWMWPRVGLGSEQHDLWAIQGLRQRFEEWLGKEAGPVCATLGVKNSWMLEDRKIVDEWVWIRAFRTTEAGRAVDVALTWRPLETITLQGEEVKGYGGLSFRLAPRVETVITTPDGRQEGNSDLLPYPWADQSGVFEGATGESGVAIFQFPGNTGFPAGWCLRYYGFLGVSWPGRTMAMLKPGENLTLRFRLWIHRGGVEEGRVAEAYAAFLEPITLRLDLG